MPQAAHQTPKLVCFRNQEPQSTSPQQDTDMGEAEVTNPADAAAPGGVQVTSQGQEFVAETQIPAEEAEEELTFTTMARRKARPNVMIQTSAFGDDNVSIRAKCALLAKCIHGLALPFGQPAVQRLKIGDQPTEPYFVFEAGTEVEVQTLLQAGIQQGEGENARRYHFQHMTDGHHTAEESRSIEIISLQYNTASTDLQAAMTVYGAVESVRMASNATKSMATAKVVFKSANAVAKMNEDNITTVFVRHDTGIVVRRGITAVRYQSDLTLKLVHLPVGITPREVECTLKEAGGACHRVTVPLDPYTKQRLPKAYILFASEEDQMRLHTCAVFV
ncbi:hypothetical protein EDD11_009974 [Mortierella claussenii]|nr:hypothetical protein EDD11_009974 [Mortierella claussenii]